MSAAAALIRPLAWELLYATGAAKKKKKKSPETVIEPGKIFVTQHRLDK